jgi:hypothetical protein
MCHIVSAPAKTSEKMINDAATRIKEAFTILDDCKFLTFSFLEGTTNRFRQGMLEYCKTETTSLEIMQSTYADQAFLRQIEQNQTTKALIRALNSIQGALPRCFALSVVRPNLNVEDPENRLEDYRKLAEAVWKKRANIGHNWTLQSVKDSFSICIEEFRGMKKNAKDYLADPGSRAFLRRDPPNNNRPRDANFSRRDALHQVFSPSTTSAYFMTLNERVVPYDLLLSRNFQTLHDVHEAYWRRPSMFGYH